MKDLLRLPEIVEDTARDYQAQRVCLYATELAASFHKFYGECQVICDQPKLAKARLVLAYSTKTVLAN